MLKHKTSLSRSHLAESYVRSRKPCAWPEGRGCSADSVFSTAPEASSLQVCRSFSAAALSYPLSQRHTADGCRLSNTMSSHKQDIWHEPAQCTSACCGSFSAPVAEFGARVQERADAKNAWFMSLSFTGGNEATHGQVVPAFREQYPWLSIAQAARLRPVGLTTKAQRFLSS